MRSLLSTDNIPRENGKTLGTRFILFTHYLLTLLRKKKLIHVTLLFVPFPNKPWFLRVCRKSLLKTLWEKEKLVITSNFSFPSMFSTCLRNFLPFTSNLKLSSANSFSLVEPIICRLGKG